MQAESKGSFAVIRYNLRTYESGGVMAVSGREVCPRRTEPDVRRPAHRVALFSRKTDLKWAWIQSRPPICIIAAGDTRVAGGTFLFNYPAFANSTDEVQTKRHHRQAFDLDQF
jgi:hypothetical protein